MRNVLHITKAFGSSSQRIIKQSYTYRKHGHDVYILSKEIRDVSPQIKISIKATFQDYNVISSLKIIRELNPSTIILHNMRALIYARILRRLLPTTEIIYDAHELESETNGKVGKPWKKSLTRMVENYNIPVIDRIWVVSESINDWYQSRYPKTLIQTIYNYPQSSTEIQDIIKNRIKLLDEGRINFVYQGKLTSARYIDKIVEIFKKMPQSCILNIYGFGPLSDWIESQAKSHENIVFHGKILPDDLNKVLNNCHVGFSLLKMNCLNHKYAMPNKLFNYLNAGLYIISIKDTDQANLIEQLGRGIGISEKMNELSDIPKDVDKIYAHCNNLIENPALFIWLYNEEKIIQ